MNTISDAVELLNLEIDRARKEKTVVNYVSLALRVLRSVSLSDDDLLYLAAEGLAPHRDGIAPESATFVPDPIFNDTAESGSTPNNGFRFSERSTVRPVMSHPVKHTPAILLKLRKPFGVPMPIVEMGVHALSKVREISAAQVGGHKKWVEGCDYAISRLKKTGKRKLSELSEAELEGIAKKFEGAEVANTVD